MRFLQFLRILFVIPGYLADSDGSVLRAMEVPQYAFVGSWAPITCFFDLRRRQLYSLKWYQNTTEFYRYVPKEKVSPVVISENSNFLVQELFRSSWRLTLNLTKLTSEATGNYTCEIIAEYPSFRSESESSLMTVLNDQLLPPILLQDKVIYDPEDTITLNCQHGRPFRDKVKPHIEWYLGKIKVNDSMATPSGEFDDGYHTSSSLHLSASEVLRANGTALVECHLVLGNVRLEAFSTLRVRRRLVSFINGGASHDQLSWVHLGFLPLCLITYAV